MNIMLVIKKSKKYSSVYQPLLERMCAEESVKYKKDKDKIKAVKNKLHEIYGAFFNENVGAICDRPRTNAVRPYDINSPENLLKLNVSSNERLSFISELYKFIFDTITDNSDEEINTILDIGCGFNPFSLKFMLESSPKVKIKSYYALDIDLKLAEIINNYFDLLGLPKYAGCIDIISEIPPQKADIAFLFKIIPTVETCKKGRGAEIINNINAKYIAVSFPTKTLCGKDKGMADNYAAFFENILDYDKFAIIGKNIFKNELVYIISLNSK